MNVKTIYPVIALLLGSVFIPAGATNDDSTEQEQVTRELEAMLNAAKQYQLDTGRALEITPDTNVEYGYLAIDNLIEDPGIEGWNGPYLPYSNDWFGFEQYVSHPEYIASQLLAKEDTEWNKGSTPEGCNENSTSCKIAACIWSVPEEVAKGINEEIDGIQSVKDVDSTGVIRYNGGSLVWIVCMTGDEYKLP
ncbi:hypothetical protein [Vibrio coralliilyticus]|uniref:hypothetical protein n=1 Tax=Vibrio coralliilyticus TaxID=190893 RepID=UPI000C16F12E|nr:hypothetical protein [Vibrio coralliilyticus]